MGGAIWSVRLEKEHGRHAGSWESSAARKAAMGSFVLVGICPGHPGGCVHCCTARGRCCHGRPCAGGAGAEGRGAGTSGLRGQIVRVLERQRQRFVGTYFEAGRWGYVEVDGGLFPSPIFVGDPGAKGVRPDDKVVIEIIRYPTPYAEGEGVIVEGLGERASRVWIPL